LLNDVEAKRLAGLRRRGESYSDTFVRVRTAAAETVEKTPQTNRRRRNSRGMSCYSVAEEIMPGRTDYLVEQRGSNYDAFGKGAAIRAHNTCSKIASVPVLKSHLRGVSGVGFGDQSGAVPHSTCTVVVVAISAKVMAHTGGSS
jgi:hypothetical protein